MPQSKRVFLIHAVSVAIEPINTAFQRLWPEARPFNLLDDSLSADLEASGTVTDDLANRLLELARYAESANAGAVLFTCSAYGTAIDSCRRQLSIPVMRPSEAMVAEALQLGSRIAVLATFEPAIAALRGEIQAMASVLGRSVEISSYTCPEAMMALRAGDATTHDRLIAEMASNISEAEVLCFAQFSMTSAIESTRAATPKHVLTTPDSAVLKLRQLLTASASGSSVDPVW